VCLAAEADASCGTVVGIPTTHAAKPFGIGFDRIPQLSINLTRSLPYDIQRKEPIAFSVNSFLAVQGHAPSFTNPKLPRDSIAHHRQPPLSATAYRAVHHKLNTNDVTDNEIVMPVPEDAPPAPSEHFELKNPTETWTYTNTAGATIGYVCRFDPPGRKKEFRPLTLHRINDKLEWRWEGWKSKRPLYGLRRLAERPLAKVLVAEGEKSADAAQKLLPDHVTVTSPNGSKSAYKADWSQLHDREVVIWPDADPAGERYCKDVIGCLTAVGVKSVAVVTPPDEVKEGWDAADALEEGWKAERAAELIAVAVPATGRSDVPDSSESKPAVVAIEKVTEEIQRLASLSIVQYELEREKAAKRLGMRTSVLDDAVKSVRQTSEDTKGQGRRFEMPAIEPWPSAIDGAELLGEATEAIKAYLVLPANSAETLALWAVHTHCFNCFAHSPRAAITSPEKGCGNGYGSTCWSTPASAAVMPCASVANISATASAPLRPRRPIPLSRSRSCRC
jgi:hypothetical protein